MTFSYDPTHTTDLDRVRFAIGDTVEISPLLQDEEIEALIDQHGTVLAASLGAARSLMARFARVTSTTKGDVRVEGHRFYEHYRDLVAQLTDQADDDTGAAVPYAGGLTVSDVQERAANPDRVDPFFTRRTGDNPPWRLNGRERWS